jgi:single-strand DNA-binding protein
MINSIILEGRMGSVPEIFQIQTRNGEKPKASFRIAVDRPIKNAQGEKVTDWFNCFAFNSASFIQSLGADVKGKLVIVRGRMEQRTYEKNGQKVVTFEVNVDEFELLERTTRGVAETPDGAPAEAPPEIASAEGAAAPTPVFY